MILDGLKDRLMHPDLVKEFISAFHAEINQYRQQLDVERKAKERDLVQVDMHDHTTGVVDHEEDIES